MTFFKKYWYLFVITAITVGLGVMVFLTSQQLAKREPVTEPPTQAAVPACTVSFSLELTPTPTGTPTSTPTGTPVPTSTPTSTPTGTPVPTSTMTPTPTATQIVYASCNGSCTVNDDCTSGLVCLDGRCRSASYPESTTCSAPAAPSTPNIPVAGTGPSILGASVIAVGFLSLLLGLLF